jgi:hypothetical protein
MIIKRRADLLGVAETLRALQELGALKVGGRKVGLELHRALQALNGVVDAIESGERAGTLGVERRVVRRTAELLVD